MIEVVAGFAIILVVTGLYLWWPRGRISGVVSLRESPRKRASWRDLHAVTVGWSPAQACSSWR